MASNPEINNKDAEDKLKKITGTNDEIAAQIFAEVNKTDCAYRLSKILKDKYKGKTDELISKLPKYIQEALEYVIPSKVTNSNNIIE